MILVVSQVTQRDTTSRFVIQPFIPMWLSDEAAGRTRAGMQRDGVERGGMGGQQPGRMEGSVRS